MHSVHEQEHSAQGNFEAMLLQANFACRLLHAGFLFGSFLDPEDGGDSFL
jgi:hypothetical protein